MTRYDVRIEPMPYNPVREEHALGKRSGLYRLEVWVRDSAKSFRFKSIAKENLSFDEAQTVDSRCSIV